MLPLRFLERVGPVDVVNGISARDAESGAGSEEIDVAAESLRVGFVDRQHRLVHRQTVVGAHDGEQGAQSPLEVVEVVPHGAAGVDEEDHVAGLGLDVGRLADGREDVEQAVVAAGAGAASRQAIGTAVVGGMVAATVMSLLFTPVFYVMMQRLSEYRRGSKKEKAAPAAEEPAE